VAIRIEQTRFEAIPTGGYPAVVTGLEEQEGQYGPQIKWTFTVDWPDTDWHGSTLPAWTSARFGSKSKLYQWTKAVFGGRDIPADYVWDSSHVLGKKVRIVVIEKIRPADGSEFSKVEDVLPFKAEGPVKQPDATPPPPPPMPPAGEADEFPF
jgi:hypothetical protein